MNQMKAWLQLATPGERSALADALGTSVEYLGHYGTGYRRPSAESGIALEHETRHLHESTGGRLPIVYRTALVPACRGCEFAIACLGKERIEADEFPVMQGGSK
jgi:hypothetical protein